MEENCKCASALFKLLDPVEHASYKKVYDRVIPPRRDLRAVCLKDNVFCSMVVIINLNVAPHCEASDKNTGWVATQVFGDFAGGGLVVCPDLGLMFDMQPGDMIYMRAALLEHYVTPWETGERTSCVFWTHGGLFKKYDPESVVYSEKSKARRSKGDKRKRDSTPSEPLDDDLERCDAEQVDDELVHRKPKKGKAHRLKERAKRANRRHARRAHGKPYAVKNPSMRQTHVIGTCDTILSSSL
jgi:hypothetical protein